MIRISKEKITHYLLIYLMLLVPASCLFAVYLPAVIKYYALVGMYALMMVFRKKYRNLFSLGLVGLFLCFTLFTRFLNGGAGINSWMQFTITILSTSMAVCYNREMFLTRFVKTVRFFAVISMVFWAAFCAVPRLVDLWPVPTYVTQALGTVGWQKIYHGKGLLLYSYLQIHPTRNCGFYTEPGVHQIVLNSALFVLLFWKDKLHLDSEKQYKHILFTIMATVITAQSTTGYLAFVLIIMFFYINSQRQHGMKNLKTYIVLAVFAGVIVLFADYALRAEESLLFKQIIQKLFGGSGGLDISAGTGQYRMGTIIVGLNSILQHPLGVGYDAFNAAKNAYAQGLVAASFISFAAIYGVIPWITVLLYIFVPVFTKQRLMNALLLFLLFVNTTLGQTELVYPGLLLAPIYLMTHNRGKLRKAA